MVDSMGKEARELRGGAEQARGDPLPGLPADPALLALPAPQRLCRRQGDLRHPVQEVNGRGTDEPELSGQEGQVQVFAGSKRIQDFTKIRSKNDRDERRRDARHQEMVGDQHQRILASGSGAPRESVGVQRG